MIIMAADYVGYKITEFLCSKGENIRAFVYDTEDRGNYNDTMLNLVKATNSTALILSQSSLKEENVLRSLDAIGLSLGILAWWPYIIRKPVLSLAKFGFVNTHPSYLPFNRGKHPYFWSLVENTKFGVTLHYVNEEIDNGDIIAQREIPVSWTDSGESLYIKAREEILDLFYQSFNDIKNNRTCRIKQQVHEGSFHWGKELDSICEIKLDKEYRAGQLLNILRGRMFNGKGEAYFIEKGKNIIYQLT